MSTHTDELNNKLKNTHLTDEDLDIDDDSSTLNNDDPESETTPAPTRPSFDILQQEADAPTFDFHRFLEQFKDPSTKPIAKATVDFIKAFQKKEGWTVQEQADCIQDYLNNIYIRMRTCDVWRDISDKEFENTKEGMEKLLMNRLYSITFSPSTTDDKEKDEIIHHKIKIFRWVREKHLDIPITEDNDSFLTFAQSELIKMNSYKAPRDKLICILNCCKIIYGLLRHMGRGEGADGFFPILIYILIRANPPKLISNVQYIYRFRSPQHLKSEAAYYLANLMAAISFIETMDMTSLSISKEEFDSHIEATMLELKQEQPEISTDRKPVSYENAVHPMHAKKKNTQTGSDITNRSLQYVDKLLVEHDHPMKDKSAYDDPSSLSQQLPFPTESMIHSQSQQNKRVSQQKDDETRKKFDENLSTIISMFSNIEPDVCFMILQASDNKLQQTIESLLEMSNEQNKQ